MIHCFHGVMAYRGSKNPMAVRDNIDTLLSGVEACGADRPIGAMGVVAVADCRAAYLHDCWSEVSEGGERTSSETPASLVPDTDEEVQALAEHSMRSASGHYEDDPTRVIRREWVAPTCSHADAEYRRDFGTLRSQKSTEFLAQCDREEYGYWNPIYAQKWVLDRPIEQYTWYCEFFIRTDAISAIWVKDWADAKVRRCAEVIAHHRGIPLIVVTGQTRIWDVTTKLDGRVYWAGKEKVA